MNDQFASAKYLIRRLNLSRKLQFRLDLGHLKHRLLNLNVSSSIIVIDLEHILKECIAFAYDANGNDNNNNNNDDAEHNHQRSFSTTTITDLNQPPPPPPPPPLSPASLELITQSTYVFDICFKLLNEFKDLNELNNQGRGFSI